MKLKVRDKKKEKKRIDDEQMKIEKYKNSRGERDRKRIKTTGRIKKKKADEQRKSNAEKKIFWL